MIHPEWCGDTCFILGCGPSLKGMNVSQLRHQGRVIAINDSWMLEPRADVLYFCDQKWWDRSKHAVRDGFTGRYIVTLENKIEGVIAMRNTGEEGLETDPTGLRNGCNSGFQAINLAYHFGAKKIILLGYDMQVSNGELHWNHRPERQDGEFFQRVLTHSMLPHFESLKVPLWEAGVEVINCTPNSALRVWPMRSLYNVLTAHA